MLFNSFPYILFFLPLSIILYYFVLARYGKTIANFCLVIFSFIFYSWWNIIYLPLLLGSITINYVIGRILIYPPWQSHKKRILIAGILFNLTLLAYYKYTNFFINNIDYFSGTHFTLYHILLPLGISFFTFTQTAFLVDAYQGKVKEYSFINYALFASFFPHLLAGPIIHHSEMMPQFADDKKRKVNYNNMLVALFLFSVGLFKKVVIADTFAIWATQGFDASTSLDFFFAWQTSLSYTFQLYFDFSGYTDMAIASALFFNIKFPINFFSPYKSLDIQDFWRRWHITLSRFLRNYLYIPLGGNRTSTLQVYFNLLVTFILGGLWHGANWAFVFWGFCHGTASIIHRIWGKLGFKLNKYIAWFIMFNFINLTWIFFRAHTWHDAFKVLKGMFNWHHINFTHPVMSLCTTICMVIALLICVGTKNSMQLMESKMIQKSYSPLIIAMLLVVSFMVLSIQDFLQETHAFLYFQF